MTEIYYLVIIIAVFSVVQSIFGVGLLLFGTPTLLLLEYSYSETLWLLLPCSVTISLIQVVNDYKLIEAKKRAVYLVIPTLVLSLALVVTYENGINITRIVGVLLLLIGVIRFSSKLQALLSSTVKKHIQYIILLLESCMEYLIWEGGLYQYLCRQFILKKKLFVQMWHLFI